MPNDTGRTLLRALEVFRPAFTAPTFAPWMLIMAAWVLGWNGSGSWAPLRHAHDGRAAPCAAQRQAA